jgi:eukaryotic-like serine/threonine-protein kinase
MILVSKGLSLKENDMIRSYEDFEVRVTKQGDQLYADLGAAPGSYHLVQPIPIVLPDDRTAWAEAYQGRKSEAELAELGHRLFDAIITGELAEKWNACLGEIRQRTKVGLRLRFSLQADALTDVPLELLCKRTQPTRDFLALDQKTPIVRSPRSGGTVKERSITKPLRMLVVIANPVLKVQTDPIAQQAGLEEALADLVKSRKLMIDYLGLPGGPRADYDCLQYTLVQADAYPYDIVHFIGHGSQPDDCDTNPEGSLLLASSKNKRSQSARSSDLAGVLASSGVRIAVLQACGGARGGIQNIFQGVAQQFIAKGLPAVVAMQCPVDMDVATRFCNQFYNFWLAKGGLPIERALAVARGSIRQNFKGRTAAWWTPVLFIRQQSTKVLTTTLNRKPFSISLKRGGILLERDRIDEAVTELKGVYEEIPDEARPLLTRALAAQAQMRKDEGNAESALSSCNRALEISPDQQTVLEMRASILHQRGDEAQQEGDLDTALKAYEQAGATQKVKELKARKQSEQEVSKTPEAEPLEVTSEKWQPGHELLSYEVVEKLATTECYEVYKATKLDGKLVAIKRLKPEKRQDKQAIEFFRREVAMLDHFKEHIDHRDILLQSWGTKDTAGDLYFTTEFADRGTLKDYLEGNRLSPIEALNIAKIICQGIQAVHNLGIIHRDIKPDNIFLFSKPDGGVMAKLADFSIAMVPNDWKIKKIFTGFVGTRNYAAPEQFTSSSDRRSDLYSWGIVFFEMLTGERLFEDSAFEFVMSKEVNRGGFTLFDFTERGIPLELAKILQKVLQLEPQCRYQSAKEVLETLDSIQPPTIATIKQHLQFGEECGNNLEWLSAKAEFEQGIEFCRWYGELDKHSGQLGELLNKLKAGHLCAEGMVYSSKRRWSEAIEAFETLLWEFGKTYLDVDVVKRLGEAQSRQADDEHKLHLYTRGIELEADNPEDAYAQFYRLYKDDPNYKDVADRCATIAFQIGKQQESWKQKVDWLEKVTDTKTANHIDGRTRPFLDIAQQRLDSARHRWAKELLVKSRSAAIAQLEEISSSYDHWSEVYQSLIDAYYHLLLEGKYSRTEKSNLDAEAEASYRLGIERWCEGDLQSATEHFARIYPGAEVYKNAHLVLVQIYVMLGRQEHKKAHWQDAAEWWDKALAISPDEVYQALVNDYCRLLRSDDYVRTGWSKLDAEAEARYRLGVERWGKGDLEDAVEQFEEILRISKEVEVSELEGALFALAQIAQEYKELGHRNKSWSDASESLNRAKDIRATLREYGEEPKTGLLLRIVRGNRKRDN